MGKRYTKTQLGIYFVSLVVLLASVITRKGDSGMATIGVVAAMLLFMFERSSVRMEDTVEGEGLVKMKRMQTTYRFVVGVVMVGLAGLCWMPVFKDSIPHADKIFRIVLTALVMLFIGMAAPKLTFENKIGLPFAWIKGDEVVWKMAHTVLKRITVPIVALLVVGGIFLDQSGLLVLYCIVFWLAIPGFSSWKFSKLVAVKRQQMAKQKASQTGEPKEEEPKETPLIAEETQAVEQEEVIVVSDDEITIEDENETN